MFGKFKIRTLSNWCLMITTVLAALCITVCFFGSEKYAVLHQATEDYVVCEAAAYQLQQGSDFLTKQARLAAVTGEQQYIDAYFQEANITQSREKAIEELSSLHGDQAAVEPLQEALSASIKLMETEYYSMRLVEEAGHTDAAGWPKEIQAVALSAEDASLSDGEKLSKAQDMLIGIEYENAKDEISGDVESALSVLTEEITDRQYRASNVFSGIFRTIIICVIIFAVLMLLDCLIMRRGIVRPLLEYCKSIRQGPISPIHGVSELQMLAETYNSIYAENEEREVLMKHQAEHDPLTELLNRGSFDHILALHEKSPGGFALILADIDTFKKVNDTYGHAIGDLILKRVAALLKNAFRSVDYVCRIGGDEFAVIMVEMTVELYYTITDKISEVNRQLSFAEGGTPAVSISAGVAFSDQVKPGEQLFKNADRALYYTKEHGRGGCSLYPV